VLPDGIGSRSRQAGPGERTPLYAAAAAKRVEAVAMLLAAGASVNK